MLPGPIAYTLTRMAQVPGSVAPIVQAVRERLPGLIDRMAHRIRTEVPVYEDVVDAAEHRTSVQTNVEYVLGGLFGDDVRDLAAPMATGRARAAQGVPLAEMLAAHRLGFAEVWHEMVAVAQALPEATDSTLVELAGDMFTLHSRYADASVSGYRHEYQGIVRTTARSGEPGVTVRTTRWSTTWSASAGGGGTAAESA